MKCNIIKMTIQTHDQDKNWVLKRAKMKTWEKCKEETMTKKTKKERAWRDSLSVRLLHSRSFVSHAIRISISICISIAIDFLFFFRSNVHLFQDCAWISLALSHTHALSLARSRLSVFSVMNANSHQLMSKSCSHIVRVDGIFMLHSSCMFNDSVNPNVCINFSLCACVCVCVCAGCRVIT